MLQAEGITWAEGHARNRAQEHGQTSYARMLQDQCKLPGTRRTSEEGERWERRHQRQTEAQSWMAFKTMVRNANFIWRWSCWNALSEEVTPSALCFGRMSLPEVWRMDWGWGSEREGTSFCAQVYTVFSFIAPFISLSSLACFQAFWEQKWYFIPLHTQTGSATTQK